MPFPPARVCGIDIDPFFNANTPQELDQLRAMLAKGAPMTSAAPGPIPVIGIAGWKKSGKTTLVVRLIEEFTRRGLKVATVKHAHHNFQIDDDETDSARHRRAGAAQVAIVSAKRWALIGELGRCARSPILAEVIAWLGPVRSHHRRGLQIGRHPQDRGAAQRGLQPGDAGRQATPTSSPSPPTMPRTGAAFRSSPLDDIAGIADFIAGLTGLHSAAPRTPMER